MEIVEKKGMSGIRLDWSVCIFEKYLQDGFTKIQTRGTRDYGMCDVDFESNLVLTFICVVEISHYVVACSPEPDARDDTVQCGESQCGEQKVALSALGEQR